MSEAAQKPDEVKALVSGYFNTLKYINKNLIDSRKTMADFERVSLEDFNKSMSGIKIPGKSGNYNLLSGNKPLLVSTINKLQQFMLDNKIIKHSINADQLITDRFLPE